MFPLSSLTWTCHICGDDRPDNKISVAQHKINYGQRNVRYCNDNADCEAQAKDRNQWVDEDGNTKN